MTEISHETGRQVGVLVNRKGQVEYVMVGNAKQIEMPDFGRARVSEDRFRGLRTGFAACDASTRISTVRN